MSITWLLPPHLLPATTKAAQHHPSCPLLRTALSLSSDCLLRTCLLTRDCSPPNSSPLLQPWPPTNQGPHQSQSYYFPTCLYVFEKQRDRDRQSSTHIHSKEGERERFHPLIRSPSGHNSRCRSKPAACNSIHVSQMGSTSPNI